MNEIISIKQLPLIEQQFAMLSADIKKRTDEALSLVCTEDTRLAVKKVRAELNAEKNLTHETFREIKAKVFEPWDAVESLYKTEIQALYANTDSQLKGKISEVESGLVQEVADAGKEYFTEYAESIGLEGFTFDDLGIKVTLSTKSNPLKKKIREVCDAKLADLNAISGMENKAEVMALYMGGLNLADSLSESRRRTLERSKYEDKVVVESAVESIVEPVVVNDAPIVKISEPEETIEITLTVRAERSKLKKLEAFLVEGGYDYD